MPGLSLSGERGHKGAEVDMLCQQHGEGSQPRTEASALPLTCCSAHAHIGVLGCFILTARICCGAYSPPEGIEAFSWNS